MSWLGDIVGSGIEGIIGEVGDAVDELHLSGEEKQTFTLKLHEAVQGTMDKLLQSINSVLAAKERVLVAELEQGDRFTKRARPSVVYVGLAFIGVNYVLFPCLAWILALIAGIWNVQLPELPSLALPGHFWAAWGGVCGTYAIGRSVEKAKIGGILGRVARVITGEEKTPRLLE